MYPGHAGLRAAAAPLLAAAAAGAPAGHVAFLDGELYRHGAPLQDISGDARRGDEGETLSYVVFDLVYARRDGDHWAPSAHDDAARAAALAALPWPAGARLPWPAGVAGAWPADATSRVKLAPSRVAHSEAEIEARAAECLAAGLEGAVARLPGVPYEPSPSGYHSRRVLKYKPRHDAEFPLAGYFKAARGKAAGLLMWRCTTVGRAGDDADDDGAALKEPKEFSVTPKLPAEARRALAARLDAAPALAAALVGLPYTVSYAELSADGVPLQPTGLGFRTPDGGPPHPALVALGLA